MMLIYVLAFSWQARDEQEICSSVETFHVMQTHKFSFLQPISEPIS